MSFELDQQITYWEVISNNGTGGKTYANGILTDAKIADIDEIVFTKQGKQFHATKAVYTNVVVPVGSKLIEGDSTAALAVPVAGSQLVIKRSGNPSLTDMNRVVL